MLPSLEGLALQPRVHNSATESLHLDGLKVTLGLPSVTMNFFRYIIDGHEAETRQRVLSCPRVLLPQASLR